MKGSYLKPCFAIIMFLTINTSCEKDIVDHGFNGNGVPLTPENITPPIANAGADKFIRLPINSVELDGSASYDSSGSDLKFMWSFISGPTGSFIIYPSFKATLVSNLSEGIYSIELMVRNGANLSSRDTMNIIVSKPPNCQSNRGENQIQLTLLGTIPGHISYPELISVGNKLIFPQWGEFGENETNKINIYDIPTQNWTVTQTSKARSAVETIVAGNKIFFAGGLDYDEVNYNVYVPVSTVDIYDITTNTWTINNLSEARGNIKATVAGTKILFAGGTKAGNVLSAKVDIYDLQTNTWSSANLNGGARAVAATVTSQNKSLFIGGYSEYVDELGWGSYSLATPVGVIDVYDNITGQWSVLSISSIKQYFSAIGKENNVYLSDGYSPAQHNSTFEVDILNLNTMTISSSCVSRPMGFDGKQAAVKNDQILFYSGRGSKADIYNTQTGIWSIGVMPVNINPGNTSKISMTFNNGEVYAAFDDKLYRMYF